MMRSRRYSKGKKKPEEIRITETRLFTEDYSTNSVIKGNRENVITSTVSVSIRIKKKSVVTVRTETPTDRRESFSAHHMTDRRESFSAHHMLDLQTTESLKSQTRGSLNTDDRVTGK